ncbi:thiamine phosphate synthase [Alkalihalobacillus sp. TS-13]|uniref:thiamine phosphate synthase n=1 Tax=Alkalihalobacillus sp. TS-13 TaxID=2842455 RepID=UPI001C880D32|nr:thiamine phosphate synthase [Alkalihalobacillus sp. TS-13]
MNLRELLKLYFIMGSPNCDQDPRDVLRGAIGGGVTLFQFREKGDGALIGDAKREFAMELHEICREEGIPFIVNDDVALALELGADGVHVGQEDESIEVVREKIDSKILGVSAHDVEEAREAVEKGADYIGVGPMFATKTKADAREVRGPEMIERIREAGITLPIVGIGGIQASNASEVTAAGADGVSVISAISQAEDPKRAARDFIGMVL